MPHPGRNNIYEATIKRMVNQALEAQEQEFASNRNSDSDEQHLDYLRFCASVLQHTPWPREIVGGSLIEQRFGTWEAALLKAKLPLPTTPDKVTGFARYQEETQRQKELYRIKKAEKKQKAQQRKNAQKEKQSV
ncbi:MAG: hypothetical protein IKT52_04135 [Oscillospiraceae bacterium]|nr:hypothetical protein [Oscillospiraceae bacterium]